TAFVVRPSARRLSSVLEYERNGGVSPIDQQLLIDQLPTHVIFESARRPSCPCNFASPFPPMIFVTPAVLEPSCIFFVCRPVSLGSMNAAAHYFLMGMESEASAIARGLRRRDPDLLGRLIEQYQHRLLRYLVCLAGNRELAEDLFQETWIRV